MVSVAEQPSFRAVTEAWHIPTPEPQAEGGIQLQSSTAASFADHRRQMPARLAVATTRPVPQSRKMPAREAASFFSSALLEALSLHFLCNPLSTVLSGRAREE